MVTPVTDAARQAGIAAAQRELTALRSSNKPFDMAIDHTWAGLQSGMYNLQSVEEVQGYARGAVKALQYTSNAVFTTTIKTLMHVYVDAMCTQLGTANPLSRGF